MELNKPQLANATFHRTFPAAPWLSALPNSDTEAETPFLTMQCRAGGYFNAPLQVAIEACNVKRDVALMELKEIGVTADYVVKQQSIIRDDALARLAAVCDTCVSSWETNIVSAGAPIDPTAENLKALTRAMEPNTATAFLELTKFVNNLAAFMVDRDADAVKN